MEELESCGSDVQLLCGFGSAGASVMTGKKSGMAALLQKKAYIMIRTHCINQQLAQACGDANEIVAYIKVL